MNGGQHSGPDIGLSGNSPGLMDLILGFGGGLTGFGQNGAAQRDKQHGNDQQGCKKLFHKGPPFFSNNSIAQGTVTISSKPLRPGKETVTERYQMQRDETPVDPSGNLR